MRSILVVVILGLLATSCGGAKRNAEALSETLRSYNDGVRWERFALAAIALPPKERATFVDEMDARAKDLKITDYDIVKVDNKSRKEARVQVKLQWYLDSVGTVRETHALQTWELHGSTWWIVDEVRFRGDEMPGLPEPRESTTEAAQAADPRPASPEHL